MIWRSQKLPTYAEEASDASGGYAIGPSDRLVLFATGCVLSSGSGAGCSGGTPVVIHITNGTNLGAITVKVRGVHCEKRVDVPSGLGASAPLDFSVQPGESLSFTVTSEGSYIRTCTVPTGNLYRFANDNGEIFGAVTANVGSLWCGDDHPIIDFGG
jgi:hypothetical protein